MSRNKHGRGRPKGSGLDDSARLAEIARLMAGDPALKPTTAIKLIGVTDPSTVRRLRDKLGAAGTSVPLAGEPAPRPALQAAPVSSFQASDHQPSSTQRTAPGAASPMAAAMTTGAAPATPEWFTIWGELGFQAMASAFNLQMAIAGQALYLPPVVAVMRQQIMFNEFTLAFCAPVAGGGRTLH